MPSHISRSVYADMFGPTTGDRVRLADTDLIIEVEKDFCSYGEEVKFGGGKVIRDGMGQSQVTNKQGAVDTVITNALILDHWGIVKADVGIKDGNIAAIGKAGNPDIQPGVTIVIGPGTEVIAGEGKILTAGGFDTHIHFICPQQVDEALMSGVTSMLGGGTGPCARHLRHHLHARPLAHRAHDPGGRRFPGQPRLCRQGQRLAAGGARGNDQGRRLRAEAARRLGHDAGGDRLLSVGRRRLRYPGHDPHRHAQRIRLRRGHDQGVQGPHHPRLPHRRRRRRPRARHHQGGRAEERAAVLDQSDAALHAQHHRRTSRHADGVSPSRSVDRRGPRLRRKPHPQGNNRGGRYPARYRRAVDDVVGLAGHGPASAKSSSAPGRPRTR